MAGQDEAVKFLTAKGAKPGPDAVTFTTGGKIPSTIGKGESNPIKMTVIYDNYKADEGTRAEWGFSCLIQGTQKTILFDTGGNPEVFGHNVEYLGIDLDAVDTTVISHDHWDHTGGLPVVFEKNTKAPFFIPYGFPYDFVRRVEGAGGNIIPVKEAAALCDHVYTTGQMGQAIKEQSLIVNTPQGLVIVTGCSHQGIVNILKKAKETLNRKIHLVFGGFHLMGHSEDQVKAIIKDFKELGVEKCGATHCTGDRAIQLFKDAFGDNYVEIGSGKILHFGKQGR
jgi:7,8-dihydropterin-6-yl-methyl-4-(beta-D-ribofuranosyl)aminobenzene 5'-phosphate synthase